LEHSTEDLVGMAFKFIRDNILAAIVLIPILYVVFFGVIVDVISALFSVTLFEDFTIILFFWAILFGIAWVAMDEIQKGKLKKHVVLPQ
jgi:TRAP-type C4-dicarboxylate transport system permease small subunit